MRSVSVVLMLFVPLLLLSQSSNGVLEGKFSLDEPIVWSKVTLPSGMYSIAVQYRTSPAVVVVHSLTRDRHEFVAVSVLAGKESGTSHLVLVRTERDWVVRAINLPQMGLAYIYVPPLEKPGQPTKLIPVVVTKR